MTKKKLNIATLRLFNAIQVARGVPGEPKVMATERTVKNGYVVDSRILKTKQSVLSDIEMVIGISGEKANSSFHKSWSVVRDTPIETLVVQQIVHYLTTYGFEALSIYDETTVYFPMEELDIPDVKIDNLSLVVVRALSSEQILSGIKKLAGAGIALSQNTLDDIMAIVKHNRYDPGFVCEVKNRELRALLNDYYGLAPTDPEEFFRYLIAKLTDESLVIKNQALINKIKESNGKFLDELISRAPADLASIFYRYKPLFLAMKSISVCKKSYFNRLRKDAKKLHRPIHPDFLSTVTARIRNGNLDQKKLSEKLGSANIWKKIRLLNALNFRMNSPEAIVYRVRNGRGWASGFDWNMNPFVESYATDIFNVVHRSIVDDIRPNVEERVFYIPKNIKYALPSSEKQFVGPVPDGSYIKMPNSHAVVGIWWKNKKSKRVDIDLSMVDVAGKLGWDAGYRRSDNQILFSGDVTDAPNGASELFYFGDGLGNDKLLMVNYYNRDGEDDPIEMKIFVAGENVGRSLKKNYMIDPNNILGSMNFNEDVTHTTIGLLNSTYNRFHFTTFSASNGITSRLNDVTKHVLDYMKSKYANIVVLNDIIKASGGIVVEEKPEEEVFVDLSLDSIDKTTIIDLLMPPGRL